MNIDHFFWKSDYDLNVKEIDDQHRYFAGLIDKLIVEFNQASDSEFLKLLIAELNAYARFHFISEENMMFQSDYPRYQEHKAHHRELLDQLSAKEVRLEIEKTEQRKEEIVDYLITWFLNHTNKEDRLLADYLMSRK